MMNEGQLTLDLGLLNEEQQKRVDNFLADQKRMTEYTLSESKRKTELLLAAGFELGKHFENTVEVEDVNEVHEFVLNWRSDEHFNQEVSYQRVKGDVFLKVINCDADADANEITEKESNVWFSITREGKFECSRIVGSYRAVKASTLLQKLNDYNIQQRFYAENKLKRFNEEKQLLADLKELYPHSTSIKYDDVYEDGSRRTNRRAQVSFADGSYINFYKDWNGTLRCTKVYDVEVETLSLIDKATIVSQRNK